MFTYLGKYEMFWSSIELLELLGERRQLTNTKMSTLLQSNGFQR